MTWALHLANILVLCSFLVKDILVLRVLSITAGVFFSAFFLSQDPPMYDTVVWNSIFGLVNLLQIGRLFYQNRKIPLSHDETFLQQQYFSSLTALDIRKLYQLATVETFAQGDAIGNVVGQQDLRLILRGHLDLQLENESTFACVMGHFIGVQSFISKQDSTDTGIVVEQITCLKWDRKELEKWAGDSQQRHNLLLSALSKDLLQKMKPTKSAQHSVV